jgi:hypothetical protein
LQPFKIYILSNCFSFNTNFTSNAAEMHGGVASVVDGRLELEGGFLTLNIAGGLHPVLHLVGSGTAQYKGVYSDMNNGKEFKESMHPCFSVFGAVQQLMLLHR